MRRPLDPQREIILAVLAMLLPRDKVILDLLGDEGVSIIHSTMRRDPIPSRIEDGHVVLKPPHGQIPCLAVYNEGPTKTGGLDGMGPMYQRRIMVEYIGHLPADSPEMDAEEAALATADAVGARIGYLLRAADYEVDVAWGSATLYGPYIEAINYVQHEPYIMRTDRLWGVEVELDLWHSFEYPPYLVLDTSVPLEQVDVRQKIAAGSGEYQHDSEHEITQA